VFNLESRLLKRISKEFLKFHPFSWIYFLLCGASRIFYDPASYKLVSAFLRLLTSDVFLYILVQVHELLLQHAKQTWLDFSGVQKHSHAAEHADDKNINYELISTINVFYMFV
jgi:hypothetical protein